MIQQPALHIETDALDFGFSHFRVKMVVPGEIGELIGMACQEARGEMFHGIGAIAGETMDVYDFEFDKHGLLWAATTIGDISTSIERNEDGSFTMSLLCEKLPEGDDRFDQFAYERSMKGKLPDNFWIEPANLVRKLIAATKH